MSFEISFNNIDFVFKFNISCEQGKKIVLFLLAKFPPPRERISAGAVRFATF